MKALGGVQQRGLASYRGVNQAWQAGPQGCGPAGSRVQGPGRSEGLVQRLVPATLCSPDSKMRGVATTD